MAFRALNVSVPADTPTLLLEAQPGDVEFWIQTRTPGAQFFLGGPNLSTGSFTEFGEQFHSRCRPGDEIWVSVATNGQTIDVLVRSA